MAMRRAIAFLFPLLAQAALLRTPDKPIQLSADLKKLAHSGCEDACRVPGAVANSHCITGCETEFMQCNDAVCQQQVLSSYKTHKGVKPKEAKKEEKGKEEGKKEEKKKEKKAALLGAVDAPVVQLSADQKQKLAHSGCQDACRVEEGKVNDINDANCVTNCETEWMTCNDVTCQQHVIAHYTATKGTQGPANPVAAKKEEKKEEKKGEEKKEEKKKEKAALIGAKPVQLAADKKKLTHSGCQHACRTTPEHQNHCVATCVTGCETDYIQCNDMTCQQKVLADYESHKGDKPQEEKKEEAKKEEGKKKEEKKEEKKKEK